MSKRYVVRKIILADSAKEALEKESSHPVTDVYVEDKVPSDTSGVNLIGFKFLPKKEQ